MGSPAGPGETSYDAAATRLERAGEWVASVGSLQPSDPNLRRALHAGIAIVTVFGVGLGVFGVLGEWPDVDWTFRPGWLALGTVGLAAVLLADCEIWRRLLLALGPKLPARKATAIWLVSGLGRYVPAAALLPLLRVALSEREGVPKRICLASVIYEMALFFTAALLLGAYFLIELPDLQGYWQRFLVLAFPLVALIGLHPRIFHSVADASLQRLGRPSLPLSLPGVRVFEFVALYAVTFVAAGLSVFALANLIYPVAAADLITFVGAFAVATALSVLAFFLPGGVVARELGLAIALSPVMPAAPAVAVAVLARVVQILLELLMAGASQLSVRWRTAPPAFSSESGS